LQNKHIRFKENPREGWYQKTFATVITQILSRPNYFLLYTAHHAITSKYNQNCIKLERTQY